MALSKEKLTKYTAIYRCIDDISNFKLRIKYNEVDAEKVESDQNVDACWHIKIISWQEKHFSKTEKEFYSDHLNCATDLEQKYHEQVREQESIEDGSNVFTYVEEDGYNFERELFGSKPNYLKFLMENTVVTKEYEQNDEFDFNKQLQFSINYKIIPRDVQKMYIMADLGEYIENIWIKNEQVLCSVTFDKNSKVLSIYPDFTTTKPYVVKIQNETVRYFYYLIENCSEVSEELALNEQAITKKIYEHQQSIRNRIIGDKFPLPLKNQLQVYLFLEILSGKSFEHSDVYIQYYIDLPDGWSCDYPEMLKGRTQLSHGVGGENLLHFGHCADIILQYDIQKLNQTGIPKTPYIYFEIISKGSWDRYRTEGLTYKNVPISEPGHHRYNLKCFRFTQGVRGDLRRSFIGDCSSYNDITWIGIPKEHEDTVMNKFGVNTLGTGELNVRFNIVHQSQAFLKEFHEEDLHEKLIYEKLSSSSLIKSVEEVLHAFRKARKNMLEVRKNL